MSSPHGPVSSPHGPVSSPHGPVYTTLAHIRSIRLGAHKRHHGKYSGFKSDLTYHNTGSTNSLRDSTTGSSSNRDTIDSSDLRYLEYDPSFEKGLSTTKFTSGFMRRMESGVVNELKDQEAATRAMMATRKEKLRENRTQTLNSM